MVCWNWFHNKKFWYHECWECEAMIETEYEVQDGVPYEALEALLRDFRSGRPVRYTKQLQALYGPATASDESSSEEPHE